MDDTEHYLSQFDSKVPLSQASTLPKSCYLDPSFLDNERTKIFRETWQYVGENSQLQDKGSFFTTDIAGEPIIIVRGDGDEIHALSNVCRHRGARVATQPSGKCPAFRCRYHGWTYNLAGELKGTPEFSGAEDFVRNQHCLPKFAVRIIDQLIFVNLSQSAPSEDSFGPLVKMRDTLQLNQYRFHSRKSYDLSCNWKVFVDNYLDGGYHIRTIHPALSGVIQSGKYETKLHSECNVQISPLETNPNDQKTSEFRGGSVAYYWWFFPNFMLNWYHDTVDTNLVVPLGPEKCRVFIDFFFRNADTEFQDKSIEIAHQVQMEDMDICEDAFRGMKSHTFKSGRFNPQREAAGFHFHQLIKHRLSTAASS